MIRSLFCVLSLLAFVFVSQVGQIGLVANAQTGNFSDVSENDKEMNTAIAAARRSDADFWTALENPPAQSRGFAIKVGFKDKGYTEHIWCNEPERRNGKVFATINNTPVNVTNVKDGQRLEIDPRDISDWMYIRADGKIVGGRTIRAILKNMPKAEADYFRSLLVTK